MSLSAHKAVREVLLIEPDSLVRGTVASVCRELAIVRVQQAASVAQGEQCLQRGAFDGLLISVADRDRALDLLTRLRAGEFPCGAGMPVAVMAPACDQALATRLKELRISRLLLQPFKLRDVIHTMEQMLALREHAPA